MADLMFLLSEATGVAGEVHTDPTALGMNANVYVSLAMIVFLGILVWKKVPMMIRASLDKKITEIRQHLSEAEQLRLDAEALKAEYEAKLLKAVGEAEEMRARATAEADELITKAKADATALIGRRKKMAEDRITAAEAAALADVRAAATKAAADAAAVLIAAKHGAAADKALVDQAIAEVSKA